MRVAAVCAGTASGLHVVIANESTLAAAATCFGAATRLQVAVANKPTVA